MIEYLPLVLTGLGLTASILYYTMTLRNSNKTQQMQLETRQAQLYMQLFRELATPEFWKLQLEISQIEGETVEELVQTIRSNNDIYSKLISLWWIYGEVGILVYDGLVDLRHVYHLLGEQPIFHYEKWWPVVEETRKYLGWKHPEYAYQHFEYLARRMIYEYDSIAEQALDRINQQMEQWPKSLNNK